MLFVQLIRYIRGNVRFQIKGGFFERFINLCSRGQLPLWNVSKTPDSMSAYTTVSAYRRIRPYAKKACVRPKIIERHGLPFVVHRYRKRVGLAVGVLFFAVFLMVMSQFVWTIRIEGAQQMDNTVLMQALELNGVQIGTLKRKIPMHAVERDILLRVDELSWASLSLQGTTATLKVRLRTVPPQKIDIDTPQNIIAAEDGQIKYMEVYDGQSLLKIGDTVRKGEVIVSGITEDKWGNNLLRHSRAKVIAQIQTSHSVSIPLKETVYHFAGKVVTRRYIGAFGTQIPLFIYTKIPEPYKRERVESKYEFMGFELPVTVITEKYIFLTEESITHTEEYAMNAALKELERIEKRNYSDSQIVSRKVNAKMENGFLVMKADYMVQTDIAVQKEILIESPKPPNKKREAGY